MSYAKPPATDPPPAQLRAEMALVSMALTLGADAPPAIWTLRPADFWDHRHAGLWKLAQFGRWQGVPGYTDAACFDAATPVYLGALALAHWPADVDALVARVRTAAVTRRLMDAANQLAYAWADDDKARWQGEIAALATAAGAL